jgi:hypothetical protein
MAFWLASRNGWSLQKACQWGSAGNGLTGKWGSPNPMEAGVVGERWGGTKIVPIPEPEGELPRRICRTGLQPLQGGSDFQSLTREARISGFCQGTNSRIQDAGSASMRVAKRQAKPRECRSGHHRYWQPKDVRVILNLAKYKKISSLLFHGSVWARDRDEGLSKEETY